MSNRVEFQWYDHEQYKVMFDGETVCTLYKTNQGFWTIRSEGCLLYTSDDADE